MISEIASRSTDIFTRYRRGQRFTNNDAPRDIKGEIITLESSKQMVRDLNKKFQMENPKENALAINIKAIIEEAGRVKKNLKLLQPEDNTMSLTISHHIEIKRQESIKKHWGKMIEKLRKEASKKPNLLARFEPELLKKLNLQLRK